MVIPQEIEVFMFYITLMFVIIRQTCKANTKVETPHTEYIFLRRRGAIYDTTCFNLVVCLRWVVTFPNQTFESYNVSEHYV